MGTTAAPVIVEPTKQIYDVEGAFANHMSDAKHLAGGQTEFGKPFTAENIGMSFENGRLAVNGDVTNFGVGQESFLSNYAVKGQGPTT